MFGFSLRGFLLWDSAVESSSCLITHSQGGNWGRQRELPAKSHVGVTVCMWEDKQLTSPSSLRLHTMLQRYREEAILLHHDLKFTMQVHSWHKAREWCNFFLLYPLFILTRLLQFCLLDKWRNILKKSISFQNFWAKNRSGRTVGQTVHLKQHCAILVEQWQQQSASSYRHWKQCTTRG